jgi:hypothetical protein
MQSSKRHDYERTSRVANRHTDAGKEEGAAKGSSRWPALAAVHAGHQAAKETRLLAAVLAQLKRDSESQHDLDQER